MISDESLATLRQYKLCYLATPYSKYKDGIHMAFVEASIFAAKLLQAGVKVYSPIAHTHPLAIYGNIDPLDYGVWLPFDETMMEASDAILVVMLDGWRESRGIHHEVEFFDKRKKAVIYMDPDSFK